MANKEQTKITCAGKTEVWDNREKAKILFIFDSFLGITERYRLFMFECRDTLKVA